MWYTFDTNGNQRAVAYISVTTIFILVLFIIIYHVYAFTGVLKKLRGDVSTEQAQEVHAVDVTADTSYEVSTSSRPTYSVVESPIP